MKDEARPIPILVCTLVLVAVIAGLTCARYFSLPVRGASIAETEFSGQRAFAALTHVLEGVGAHPVGSLANARVRDRLVASLRALGYEPQVTRTFVCGMHGACAFVENILAEREGNDTRNAVLLAAHYDSVPAGQGANDDGLGVAVLLESARALRALPKPAHSVLLLLTDGEERGLLGAEAFASENINFTRVRAFVNTEARGSSGPSLLFETSADNAYLINTIAPSLARPITSSLFSAIYERMPNDTDFTVLKRRGALGANFAAVGSLAHYHTPLDRLDNVDLGTLQHQGDGAFAAIVALMNAENLAAPHPGTLVWFDVFGLVVCSYPSWAALLTAALALLALLNHCVRMKRAGVVPVRAILWGMLAVPASLLFAALLSFGIAVLAERIGLLPAPWIAHSSYLLSSLALCACFAVLLCASLLLGHATAMGLWLGGWLVWSALALLLAALAPGASFLLQFRAWLPASLDSRGTRNSRLALFAFSSQRLLPRRVSFGRRCSSCCRTRLVSPWAQCTD
ncbi:MAG: M20/M25/M40 family metallo-hydrolase [Sandaracinaceae bacterium]|nr:M20/M25/M40 family metallo-hydrolase [Sandaracinaceae bacterium]